MSLIDANPNFVELGKQASARIYGELTDLRNKLDTGEISQDQYLAEVKKKSATLDPYLQNVASGKITTFSADDGKKILEAYAPLYEDYFTPTLNIQTPGSPAGSTGTPGSPAFNPGTPGAPGVPGAPAPSQRPIYADTSGYRDIYRKYSAAGKGGADSTHQIGTYAETFRQMFNSAIGRDPTANEYNQYFQTVVINDKPWEKTLDQNQLRQETTGLLNQFYSGTAAEEAQKKAEAASTGATAPGSAFDVWQNEYRNSLGNVEQSLQDYQSKLFEKLRPQLLTSLKAQGLLDSGALNTALAGAAENLGSESQRYLANARTGIEADIANQKYGLASSPGQFKLSNIYNTIPQLTQSGQQALQNVYGNMSGMNMANMNNQFAIDMYNRQKADQPSLLNQYGGMILGGVAGGLGQGLGGKLAGGSK